MIRKAFLALVILQLLAGCTREPTPNSQALKEAAFKQAFDARDWRAVHRLGEELNAQYPYSETSINYVDLKPHLEYRLKEPASLRKEIYDLATKADLQLLSDDVLRTLILKCRSHFEAEIKRENNTTFQWLVLDEYAADTYVYAAGGRFYFEPIDERIKKFRARAEDVSYELNMWFPILRITDSLSGPQKDVKGEMCTITKDLAFL